MGQVTQTNGKARRHPIFARLYARISPAMDRGGMADYRVRLLSGLRGEVLEIGCGNGRNFTRYPAGVTRVLALDPSPYLRTLAEETAKEASVPIEVGEGVAEHLPVEDDSFDAAVACLMLCSVDDQVTALRELHRVLRPGGELRFLEHVRSPTPGLARVQRAVDATFWPHVSGGCHTGRDTEAAISASGFTIEHVSHFEWPPARLRQPTSPHIVGTAIAGR